MIDYDASREALYRPGSRPTVFVPGSRISDIGIDAACAELSRLAYLPFESDDAARRRLIETLGSLGLTSCTVFNAPATGTEAFAAIDSERGDVFVVFRGTAPGDIKDLATDLNVRPVAWAGGGNAHAGFSAAFESVCAEIQTWLDNHATRSTLAFAGHSLGAALATLAMSRWQGSRLVTFGCPRVGDDTFAATIVNENAVRYVGCCDIVCNVPPAGAWYADAGSMRYIDRSGAVCATSNAAHIAADRANARREYLAKYATRPGNVLVRELADHAPINYVRALMPNSG
jgi:hypothetical protein